MILYELPFKHKKMDLQCFKMDTQNTHTHIYMCILSIPFFLGHNKKFYIQVVFKFPHNIPITSKSFPFSNTQQAQISINYCLSRFLTTPKRVFFTFYDIHHNRWKGSWEQCPKTKREKWEERREDVKKTPLAWLPQFSFTNHPIKLQLRPNCACSCFDRRSVRRVAQFDLRGAAGR